MHILEEAFACSDLRRILNCCALPRFVKFVSEGRYVALREVRVTAALFAAVFILMDIEREKAYSSRALAST